MEVRAGQIEPELSSHDGKGFAAVVLLLLLSLSWTLAWYWPTASEIGGIWWRSDTYAHGLAVLPIFAWLVWRARARLAPLQLRPFAWMVLPIAASGVLWLLGELASVASVRHFALVCMIAFGFAGLLGSQAARVLLFPLLFLFFGVPIGDFLLPTMMDLTADFTVWALRLSGVPVYQEGLFFVVPNGRWSVVEACSGLRYLVASVMVGALYAYLNYRSLRRRLLFMVVALVVPVLANWLRAYMIVMLGYHSGNKLAVGVDHLLYGWLFFGIVIFLMFWIGNRWREDEAPLTSVGTSAPATDRAFWRAALPLFVLIPLFPALLQIVDAPRVVSAVEMSAPEARAGWNRLAGEPFFLPHYRGQRTQVAASYVPPDGDAPVAAYLAWFADQREGSEMVSWGNGLLAPGAKDRRLMTRERVEGAAGPVWEVVLQTSQGRVLVWQWYRIDGGVVLGDAEAKLRLLADRLLRQPDGAAVLILATPEGGSRTAARDRLAAFARSHGADLDAMVDEAEQAVR